MITPGRTPGLSLNPLEFNPQWMLLDRGHQQDLALLLFGNFKRKGARNALTFRSDTIASAIILSSRTAAR
jgi:hypothetical protein